MNRHDWRSFLRFSKNILITTLKFFGKVTLANFKFYFEVNCILKSRISYKVQFKQKLNRIPTLEYNLHSKLVNPDY